MASRQSEINSFLEKLIKIAIQNPNLNITNDIIYSNIVNYNCEKTAPYSNGKNFDYWIDYYKSNPNINVFNSNDWPYFCQFVNMENIREKSKDLFKVYLPLDSQHMKDGATQIFNFLTSNNIPHVSKIGKDFRNDSIVIRLESAKNVNDLETFINNNAYIQEGLIKPNPFLVNNGKFCIGFDGLLSLNSELATYITNFINDVKNNKVEFTENSYQTFYNYLCKLYNDTFVDGTNIENYYDQRKSNGSKIDKLVNCKIVLEELILSMSPNVSKEDIIKLHEEKITHADKEKNNINFLLSKSNANVEEDVKIYHTKNTIDACKALSQAIKETYNKYGVLQVNAALYRYITTGDAKGFTNDNNARNDLLSTLSPQTVALIIGSGSIENYTQEIISPKTK